MKEKHRSHCPISFGLDIFGDRWSLLVLRDIIFKRKRRYQEFLDSEEKISTNILADRLKLLEDYKIISRADDPENKKQIFYSPTKKGLDLIPIMLEIVRWSYQHDPKTAAPKEFIAKMNSDLEGLVQQIRSQFALTSSNRSHSNPKKSRSR